MFWKKCLTLIEKHKPVVNFTELPHPDSCHFKRKYFPIAFPSRLFSSTEKHDGLYLVWQSITPADTDVIVRLLRSHIFHKCLPLMNVTYYTKESHHHRPFNRSDTMMIIQNREENLSYLFGLIFLHNGCKYVGKQKRCLGQETLCFCNWRITRRGKFVKTMSLKLLLVFNSWSLKPWFRARPNVLFMEFIETAIKRQKN